MRTLIDASCAMSASVRSRWDVRIKTPIGSLSTTHEFVPDGEVLHGGATSKVETVTLQDITQRTFVHSERQGSPPPVKSPVRRFGVCGDGPTG